jgi:hypothetical protein
MPEKRSDVAGGRYRTELNLAMRRDEGPEKWPLETGSARTEEADEQAIGASGRFVEVSARRISRPDVDVDVLAPPSRITSDSGSSMTDSNV